jgi:hypothetical protein
MASQYRLVPGFARNVRAPSTISEEGSSALGTSVISPPAPTPAATAAPRPSTAPRTVGTPDQGAGSAGDVAPTATTQNIGDMAFGALTAAQVALGMASPIGFALNALSHVATGKSLGANVVSAITGALGALGASSDPGDTTGEGIGETGGLAAAIGGDSGLGNAGDTTGEGFGDSGGLAGAIGGESGLGSAGGDAGTTGDGGFGGDAGHGGWGGDSGGYGDGGYGGDGGGGDGGGGDGGGGDGGGGDGGGGDGGGDGGGWYLSSAALGAIGKDPKGEEYSRLHKIKEAMEQTPQGQSLVRRYEQVTPAVVQAINSRPDAQAIYDALYQRFLLPAQQQTEQGDMSGAVRTYFDMVRTAVPYAGAALPKWGAEPARRGMAGLARDARAVATTPLAEAVVGERPVLIKPRLR